MWTVGLIVLVGAVEISNLATPFPTWFQGTRAAWIGPLWTAVFFEVWACYAGWSVPLSLHGSCCIELNRVDSQVHSSLRCSFPRIDSQNDLRILTPSLRPPHRVGSSDSPLCPRLSRLQRRRQSLTYSLRSPSRMELDLDARERTRVTELCEFVQAGRWVGERLVGLL